MLLYLSLSTFTLAIFLLANNINKNKHAICVSLFLLTISLYGITHYFVLFSKTPFWLAVFYNHFTPLYLLLGPFLFFYVRGVLMDTECVTKQDLWHGIPALIQLIGIIPYIFSPFSLKLDYANRIMENLDNIVTLNLNLFYNADLSFLIRIGLFLFYIVYCGIFICKKIPQLKKEQMIPKKQLQVSNRWLITLVGSSFVITLYLLIITLLSFISSPKEAFQNSYWLHLISGIAYFILASSLLFFPEILYGMPRKNKNYRNNKPLNSTIQKIQMAITHQKEDPLFELSHRILTYLENYKPYIDTDFSLDSLTTVMQVPQRHISYCINTIMNTSFYHLRAALRVEYAIELLDGDIKKILTIEAIGEKAGFKTRSNFYNAFKEHTGLTPTEYYNSKQVNSL